MAPFGKVGKEHVGHRLSLHLNDPVLRPGEFFETGEVLCKLLDAPDKVHGFRLVKPGAEGSVGCGGRAQ